MLSASSMPNARRVVCCAPARDATAAHATANIERMMWRRNMETTPEE
jgi:hypothetical protein